ncbi:hypothetical protein CPB83DRAFT_863440 [Crepidotus variabilis]|uniref:Uncharacterized protein n=1 Tax=Crepidotus variabilis TaxID=179855 RepID=A0A9P6E640_9AGAR|nr:hypothetical protein CPB83DRAFT_863440 [Crepidotus variabilis]
MIVNVGTSSSTHQQAAATQNFHSPNLQTSPYHTQSPQHQHHGGGYNPNPNTNLLYYQNQSYTQPPQPHQPHGGSNHPHRNPNATYPPNQSYTQYPPPGPMSFPHPSPAPMPGSSTNVWNNMQSEGHVLGERPKETAVFATSVLATNHGEGKRRAGK